MNIKSNIIILYIISAIIASGLGFAFYYNLRFDANSSAGLIVAALCGIVTLLVGFQIYNAIEIKRELRQNVIKIKRFEKRFLLDLDDIKEKIVENRFLSDVLIKLRRTDDWERWNDLTYLYQETAELMKFLILSNINKYNITEEDDLLTDCFSTFENCLHDLKEEKNVIRIQMFNSQHSNIDKLNFELVSLFKNPHYKYEERYLSYLSDLKERRYKLLIKHGEYNTNSKTKDKKNDVDS